MLVCMYLHILTAAANNSNSHDSIRSVFTVSQIHAFKTFGTDRVQPRHDTSSNRLQQLVKSMSTSGASPQLSDFVQHMAGEHMGIEPETSYSG